MTDFTLDYIQIVRLLHLNLIFLYNFGALNIFALFCLVLLSLEFLFIVVFYFSVDVVSIQGYY